MYDSGPKMSPTVTGTTMGPKVVAKTREGDFEPNGVVPVTLGDKIHFRFGPLPAV